MVGCWIFDILANSYWPMTVRTHVNLIVLPLLETRLSAPWPDDLIQSHYPDTEPTTRYIIRIMPSAWLGSHKYSFLRHWFDSTRVSTHSFEHHLLTTMGDRWSTHLAITSDVLEFGLTMCDQSSVSTCAFASALVLHSCASDASMLWFND